MSQQLKVGDRVVYEIGHPTVYRVSRVGREGTVIRQGEYGGVNVLFDGDTEEEVNILEENLKLRKFKNYERVRYVGRASSVNRSLVGLTGTVNADLRPHVDRVSVHWDGSQSGPTRVIPQNLELIREEPEVAEDVVNHPKHYTSHPSGIECIQITEHMSFTLGNAVKYIWRADLKDDAIEDLKKARFYLDREIARREATK